MNGETRGAGAAGLLEIGFSQGQAQFVQGGAAQERSQKQAIGFEGAANLDEGPDQIIDPMQRQCRDDEVGGRVQERLGFLVEHDSRAAAPRQHLPGQVRFDQIPHLARTPAPPQSLGKQASSRAQLNRRRKVPVDACETFDNVVDGPAFQKFGVREARGRPREARSMQGPVKKAGRRIRHARKAYCKRRGRAKLARRTQARGRDFIRSAPIGRPGAGAGRLGPA